MNQKIPTLAGTIVIIILAFTAGYFVWLAQKNNPIETQLPVVIINPIKKSDIPIQPIEEIADWQTYKNDEYGFEFKNREIQFELKYPSTIEFIKDVPDYYERGTKKLEVRQYTTGPGPNMNPDYYRVDYVLSFDGVSGIKISPYASDSQPAYDSKDFVGAEKLMVDEKPAIQRITQSDKDIFIDTYVYVGQIIFDIGYAGENNAEFISLYKKILSTFKFTN